MVVTGHTGGHDGPGPPAEAGQSGGGADPGADGALDLAGSRPVSIRDVAAAAGVSYQTVSRVINDHPSVRQSTRDVVVATIARLGFRPNRAARALRGGQVQSVTVLTYNTTLYGYAALLQGIEEAARAADFSVGVRVMESAEPAAVRNDVGRAIESGGALIVVAFDRAGTAALAAVPPGVPMVAAVETPVRDEATARPWVWINDREAAAGATEYLLALGHRTVHYISIPSSTDTGQRLVGWKSALIRAEAEVPEPIRGGWDIRSGYEAGQVLALDPAVTAVLCGNDDLALGVMRAMLQAGREIPGSVSVVGFDDMPVSAYITPALTTVRLDFIELGRAAFALLREQIGASSAASPQPRPELIVRESSGPPPARDHSPGGVAG